MNDQPSFNRLYETAENQAGYFTTQQAGAAGFSGNASPITLPPADFLAFNAASTGWYSFLVRLMKTSSLPG